MKINRSDKKLKEQLDRWKARSDEGEQSSEVSPVGLDGPTFKSSVNQQQLEMLDLELQDLVEEISRRGNALLKHTTISQLNSYKQALASFLKKSLDLSTRVKRITGKRTLQSIKKGETKEHVIVKTIDENIEELSGVILKREKGRVEARDLVGEIKGLVVNLLDTVQSEKEAAS